MSTVSQNIKIALTKEEFKIACRMSLSTNPDFTVSETPEGFIVKEMNANDAVPGLLITFRATAIVRYLEKGNISISVSNNGIGPVQKNHVTQICGMIANMVKIGADQAVQRKQSVSNTPSIVNTSIPEQIKQLAELKEAGILTEDEFQAKKAELLAKL